MYQHTITALVVNVSEGDTTIYPQGSGDMDVSATLNVIKLYCQTKALLSKQQVQIVNHTETEKVHIE